MTNRAVARKTDPWTSWAAANGVTGMRVKQAALLYLIRESEEPMSLREIVETYNNYEWLHDAPQSESGIRTRVKELMNQGLVRDTGKTQTNNNGRKERLLEATP